jgi:hypothetical protein
MFEGERIAYYFELLSTRSKQSAVQWCIMERNLADEKAKSFAYYLLHAGYLFGLFFDPEDGGNVFLQNIG